MKANKWFLLFLAVCLIFSFIACDDGDDSDEPDLPGPPAETPWLCFTAGEDASKVSTAIVLADGTVTSSLPALEYSLDGGISWDTFTVADTQVTLAKTGDKMYLRAKATNDVFSDVVDNDNYRIIGFTMEGSIAASGNVMSLVDKDCETTAIPSPFCFYDLFCDCDVLTSAPELPATTLTFGCYGNMFYNCTSLTEAPELPATTMVDCCYSVMFKGCTSLETAPELKATTLVAECYDRMFDYCSSLNSITVHFTSWGSGTPTNMWVNDVAATGDFYCPSSLVHTPLEDEDFSYNKVPLDKDHRWTVHSLD